LAGQLQFCAALLPAVQDEAAGFANGGLLRSGSSTDSDQLLGMHPARLAVAVVRLQQSMLGLAECASEVAADKCNPAHLELTHSMVIDAIEEAGLQLLCAYTYVLYEQWQQQQPQPQLGQHAGTSSSSSSLRRSVRFRHQDISPLHVRLKLLPAAGRQLYLQAVRAVMQQQQLELLSATALTAYGVAEAPCGVINHLFVVVSIANVQRPAEEGEPATTSADREQKAAAAAAAVEADPDAPPIWIGLQTEFECTSPAVAAPAVLLLELLQLLAAYRDQQPKKLGKSGMEAVLEATDECSQLLQQQLSMLTACNSAGYGIWRSVVLRQSGQQLLQLLRWQVQLLVRRRPASSSSSSGGSRGSGSAAAVGNADMSGLSSPSSMLLPVMWAAGAWDPDATKIDGRPRKSTVL
jgi:hypothetical protein